MWFLSDLRFGQNNWHMGQVNPWDTKCLLSTCIFALVLILELYPHSVHVHVPSNCFANKEPTWASRSTTERIDVKYLGSIQLLRETYWRPTKFLWCLDLWRQRAFLVGQTFWHIWQMWPGLLTCLDSMWYWRLCLCLLWYSHSRHWNAPLSSLVMRDDISASRVPAVRTDRAPKILQHLFATRHADYMFPITVGDGIGTCVWKEHFWCGRTFGKCHTDILQSQGVWLRRGIQGAVCQWPRIHTPYKWRCQVCSGRHRPLLAIGLPPSDLGAYRGSVTFPRKFFSFVSSWLVGV